MVEGLISKSRRKFDRVKYKVERLAEKMVGIPKSLDAFLPTEVPTTPLGITDSNEIIWDRYLYTLRKQLERDPGAVRGHGKRWVEHQIAELGLKSGTMSYEQAQEWLHDGLFSNTTPLGIVDSMFWLRILQESKKSPNIPQEELNMDLNMLENSIISQINFNDDPIRQASDLAWYLDSNPTLELDLLSRMMGIVSTNLLSSLPEISVASMSKLSEPDLRSLIYFFDSCRKFLGSQQFAPEFTDQFAKKLIAAENYLLSALPYFNPLTDSPYKTAHLLKFADSNIDRTVAIEIYLHRVNEEQQIMEDRINRQSDHLEELKQKEDAKGFFTADHTNVKKETKQLKSTNSDYSRFLERQIDYHVRNGNLDQAYRLLSQIKDTTNYKFATVDIIRHEVKARNIDRIEARFDEYFTLRLEELKESYHSEIPQEEKIQWHQRERRGWLFQWTLAGQFLAEEGNYTIFNLPVILQYIYAGEFDNDLANLAKIYNGREETQALAYAIDHRIQKIFVAENKKQDWEKGSADRKDLDKALEALLIMRSKKFDPSTDPNSIK